MTNTCALVSSGMTVNEIVQRYPHALPILKRAGIDACCGGPLPIGEAARRHNINASDLLAEIAQAEPLDS